MWSLELWKSEDKEDSPLRKEIEKIKDKRAVKTMLRLFKLLEEFGPMLPMPNNKFLGEGIFELRDRNLGRRYYYAESPFMIEGNTEKKIVLVLAVVGDKGSQKRDIESAKKRLSQISKENIYNPSGSKIVRRK